jgi:hypothetical protein
LLRLYSEELFKKCFPLQTPAEILRAPLDELVLKICLLDEQRNDHRRGDAASALLGVFREGRLITRDEDMCLPSSSSFQAARVQKVAETGKDAYAVFHEKIQVKGTGGGSGKIYLNQVNFVSRYALLLFGGQGEIIDDAIVLDGWLKFKVGDRGNVGVVLIHELRKELDKVLLRHIQIRNTRDVRLGEECQRIVHVVRKLLQEE